MPIQAETAAERSRMTDRAGNFLASTRAVKQQTREKRKIYLARFQRWLFEEKHISLRFLLHRKPPDPEAIASALVEYGKQLYYAGKSYGIYAETVNAVAVERPLIRRQLTSAWDLAFCWLADEPHQHHPALPLSIMAAMVTTALSWGWPYEAAVIMISWVGIMRIGEVLCATRRDLVLPTDAAPGTSFALVMIHAPKTRGRAAKHQAARIDQSDVIAFLTAMYQHAPADTSIWPYSAATLRKRFGCLLSALGLQASGSGNGRGYDLGSLRPGGATFLLHLTEDSELVRRRGRWLSTRVLEIYLQEIQVCTYLDKVSPRARALIELCAGSFAYTLERAIAYLNAGIPPAAWYSLLKIAEGSPTQKSGKDGMCGEFSSHEARQNGPWHDGPSKQNSKSQGRDYDAAEKHGLEAQKIFQEVGDKAAESVACVHLAQACLKKMSNEAEGETKEALASSTYRASAERAMRAVNDAITACRHLGSKQLRAGALFWRAQVLGFRGRLEEALRVVVDAEKCFESIQSGSAMVQCKVLAADCLAGLKHYDEAKEVADQAIKQASGLHDRQAEGQAKSCLERIEKAEKKSKEVVAPPVQAAIATEAAAPEAQQAAGAAAASAAVPEKKGLDAAQATKRLMAIVKDVIAADDEISADSPLMEAGMDSLSSVQLVTEVSKEFAMSLSPSLVFDFPNVSSIVNHLVEESAG
eukprot:s698_g15.t1